MQIILVAVIVGGTAFYGGMKYAQRRGGGGIDFQSLRNLSPEERQQRIQQMSANGMGGMRGGQGAQRGANFVSGDIIAKDDKSITVKLRDGGSRIIFYSNATEVGKFAKGAVSDLSIGNTISVNGKAGSDGSMTADSIQVRPPTPPASQ